MKKTIQKSFSLLVVFLLSLTGALPVLAEGKVTFDDNQLIVLEPGSYYSASDLFDGFKNVMPGDEKPETITLSNENEEFDYLKVYMRALPHDEEGNPLSEKVAESGETIETMEEFLSQLSMTVYNGEEKIFDAPANEIGGLRENVYLGKLAQNESLDLTVELSVPIDLDNEYANRVGEIDWIFLVEGFDMEDSTVTVRKLWEDTGENRPDSILVELLENEKVSEEIELNADNQWTFTWTDLDEKSDWSVREVEVPKNYEVSYSKEGHITTITNTEKKKETPPSTPEEPEKPNEPEELEKPMDPVSLKVIKEWDGRKEEQPQSVEITLFDGKKAVETVQLGDWNNWSHEWTELDGEGDWNALETVIPKGYTPLYRVNEEGLVITNAETLIQTGQLNWPIWLLVIAGISFIFFGYKMRGKEDSVQA